MKKFTKIASLFLMGTMAFSNAMADDVDLSLTFSTLGDGIVRATTSPDARISTIDGGDPFANLRPEISDKNDFRIDLPLINIKYGDDYIDFDLNNVGMQPETSYTMTLPAGFVTLYDKNDAQISKELPKTSYTFTFDGYAFPSVPSYVTPYFHPDLENNIITITFSEDKYVVPYLTTQQYHLIYLSNSSFPRINLKMGESVVISEDKKSLVLLLDKINLHDGYEYIVHLPDYYVMLTDNYETFTPNSAVTYTFFWGQNMATGATIAGEPKAGDTSFNITWDYKTLTPDEMLPVIVNTWGKKANIVSSENGSDDMLQVNDVTLEDGVYKVTIQALTVYVDGVPNMEETIEFTITEAGVEILNSSATDIEEIYTLQGVRTDRSHMTKGIYVVNGKKVVIK